MAWVALDTGTSVIKAVVFADDGRERSVARRAVAVLHPEKDRSEQDMHAVWAAAASAVKQCAAEAGEPVRGLVCTAQGDGCWLVDAKGRPAGKAILWNDGRALNQIEAWQQDGTLDRAFRISGSVAYPGLLNAILPWLHRYQPEQLRSARWALTANGWIFSQLTGHIAAELSDASNPFSDVRTGFYSRELLAMYGAEAHRDLLPPVVSAGDARASLTQEAAEKLGLSAGLPVAMAPYDIVATAYGAGAAAPGQTCVVLGTTLCAERFTAALDLGGTPAGTTIALGGGTYLRAMPTLTGCEALEWTTKMLDLDGIAALAALAGQAAPASGAPLFLPYLSPAGERSPLLATRARGSFHGLTFETTRADLARSAFEGLSFAVRECLQACGPEPLDSSGAVRVCGGGARSDLWCQLLADVLQLPVARAAGSEMGARGAHLYALAITGEIPSVADGIARFVSTEQTFEPRRALAARYDQSYAGFLALRETARAQWRLLAEAG